MAIICFSVVWTGTTPLIITHCCSDESISNIDSGTLINALGLSHCAAWTIPLSIWKHVYYFPGGGRVDERGVVAVVIIAPKEEELQIFFLGVSNDCESSLSLTSKLTRWLVIWSNPVDAAYMCTHRSIQSTVVLGLYRSIKMLWYYKSSLCGWIGPVPMVIIVDTADSFANGNPKQKKLERHKLRDKKSLQNDSTFISYHDSWWISEIVLCQPLIIETKTKIISKNESSMMWCDITSHQYMRCVWIMR